MAIEYYAALSNVSDPIKSMTSVNAQLEPYRQYLERAEKSAHKEAFSLGWREPTDAEGQVLKDNLTQRYAPMQSAKVKKRRRDRSCHSKTPTGHWIVLESLSSEQEGETIFSAFLESKEIYDRAPERTRWLKEAAITVMECDDEVRALLLSHLPRSVKMKVQEADDPEVEKQLLFLRPNTYSLRCQKNAIGQLKDRPYTQLGPLIKLADPMAKFPNFKPQKVAKWVFLKEIMRSGNEEQRRFVEMALGTPDFALLQGPPGSGKTTAICELICQLARQGKRILLVASTHVAVDNVLENLIEWQDRSEEKIIMPIRIGDEGRVASETVRPWTLNRVVSSWVGDTQDYLDDPHRGSQAGTAARGMLQASLKKGNEGFKRLILEASNLVCGTTIGILQHPFLKGSEEFEPFDVMILDEASKTTFAEFLVPALHAKRWIIVGDRRQLSPYVEEQDLRTNLRALDHPVSSNALLSLFLASKHQSEYSLIAVKNERDRNFIAAEATERGLVAVDLDKPETHRSIPAASIIYGRPETIEIMQRRLPGDLKHIFGCDNLSLEDWKAHRAAMNISITEDPLTWEGEIAWRMIRAHELRDNPTERKTYETQLKDLKPVTDSEQDQLRFERQIDALRRVALPSVLELLQHGAGSMGWDRETVLTDGLSQLDLEQRMISLSFQHRMHPDISAFPREQFYANDNLLQDATEMATRRDWSYTRYLSGHAARINVDRKRSSGNVCLEEADVTIRELRAFAKWADEMPKTAHDPNTPWEIAVLTFYRPQERELRARLRKLCGQHGRTTSFELGKRLRIKLATVDRFQGQEADLVLLSFVKSGSAGFLNSPNRLNVALTRARFQIVLIGDFHWMASKYCRSELLKSLATSPHYENSTSWGATT
ncbi:AAA domain-containing protein [Terasakiella pusilla]|uniref:AAA domain-containing protein n=1 Tax=Terasakiella pusilla TaxID=64973 RepID=UPI003AA873D9